MQNAMKVLVLLGAFGCTSASFECDKACEHYADCVGGQFDREQCADRCEDNADASDRYEESVVVCNNCLDDFECVAACNTSCTDIIPAL